MVKKSKYKWLKSFMASKIPFLSSFFILVLSFSIPTFYNVKPMLVLIPIFFWGMKKAAYFDFISVMLFGFIQDFMDGTQFGFNMFMFLTIYFMVYYQKILPLDTSFTMSYIGFSTITFVLFLMKYFVISIMFVNNIDFFSIILSWAILILFYPVLNWLLVKINDKIVSKY